MTTIVSPESVTGRRVEIYGRPGVIQSAYGTSTSVNEIVVLLDVHPDGCEGHESLAGDLMGAGTDCDGSCEPSHRRTVADIGLDDVEFTDSEEDRA